MTFLFTWVHNDGSLVEFSDQGWRSDDPEKSAWLVKMSELCSSHPVLAPAIRIWLQENCQLVQFSGLEDAVKPISVLRHSGSELNERQAPARAVNGDISPNFSERTERAARRANITARSISLACEKFFRSRGLPLKQNFNAWRRSQQTRKENQA